MEISPDAIHELMSRLPEGARREVEERVMALRDWRISLFQPHPKQNLFFRSGAKTRLFLGGNRSGKTTAGILEDIAHALGCRPWLSRGDAAYETGYGVPTRGRIVCEDFQVTAKTVIVPKLWEWLPKESLAGAPKKNAVGVEHYWTFKNGSTIEIMTNEQDSKVFEGWDGHWVHFDEPPLREHFIACKRGLVDHSGRMWFAMTPLKEPWIYDELVLKADAGQGNIDVFTVDTEENVGYGLTSEAVAEFASALTDDEKEARLRGKFRQLMGLIYKSFDPAVHLIQPFPIPKDWPHFLSIDPHPRTPHAVVWGAVSPREELFIHQELFAEALIPELCFRIREMSKGMRFASRVIDPSAFILSPMDGSCWADEFRKNGLPVYPGSKELSRAIQMTQGRFKGPDGKPTIFLFNNLERLVWELGRYQWADWSGRSAETRSPKEKPKDKDDHCIEAMHRIVLQDPHYRNMVMGDEPLDYPPCGVF